MTRLIRNTLIGAASLALLAAPATASEHHGEDAAMTKGEKRLAKMLEGREAGEPVSCIRYTPSPRLTVIEDTAYVYGSGKTIYVQRTRHPDKIDDSDALVLRLYGSRLCRQDTLTTVDRASGFFSGVVFLEDFVPYTRVEDLPDAEG